ncbi:hypothetical protein LINPERHAP2_LOCUS14046, partial [Linum perenne]
VKSFDVFGLTETLIHGHETCLSSVNCRLLVNFSFRFCFGSYQDKVVAELYDSGNDQNQLVGYGFEFGYQNVGRGDAIEESK